MIRSRFSLLLAGLVSSAMLGITSAAAADPPKQAAPAADNFVNPAVEPGKVQWHPTFAAACEASQKSGKPVLLFQMMSKLDERFC